MAGPDDPTDNVEIDPDLLDAADFRFLGEEEEEDDSDELLRSIGYDYGPPLGDPGEGNIADRASGADLQVSVAQEDLDFGTVTQQSIDEADQYLREVDPQVEEEGFFLPEISNDELSSLGIKRNVDGLRTALAYATYAAEPDLATGWDKDFSRAVIDFKLNQMGLSTDGAGFTEGQDPFDEAFFEMLNEKIAARNEREDSKPKNWSVPPDDEAAIDQLMSIRLILREHFGGEYAEAQLRSPVWDEDLSERVTRFYQEKMGKAAPDLAEDKNPFGLLDQDFLSALYDPELIEKNSESDYVVNPVNFELMLMNLDSKKDLTNAVEKSLHAENPEWKIWNAEKQKWDYAPAIDEFGELVMQTMADGTTKPVRMLDYVTNQSIRAFRISRGGNWGPLVEDARQAVDEGRATSLQIGLAVVGPRMIRLPKIGSIGAARGDMRGQTPVSIEQRRVTSAGLEASMGGREEDVDAAWAALGANYERHVSGESAFEVATEPMVMKSEFNPTYAQTVMHSEWAAPATGETYKNIVPVEWYNELFQVTKDGEAGWIQQGLAPASHLQAHPKNKLAAQAQAKRETENRGLWEEGKSWLNPAKVPKTESERQKAEWTYFESYNWKPDGILHETNGFSDAGSEAAQQVYFMSIKEQAEKRGWDRYIVEWILYGPNGNISQSFAGSQARSLGSDDSSWGAITAPGEGNKSFFAYGSALGVKVNRTTVIKRWWVSEGESKGLLYELPESIPLMRWGSGIDPKIAIAPEDVPAQPGEGQFGVDTPGYGAVSWLESGEAAVVGTGTEALARAEMVGEGGAAEGPHRFAFVPWASVEWLMENGAFDGMAQDYETGVMSYPEGHGKTSTGENKLTRANFAYKALAEHFFGGTGFIDKGWGSYVFQNNHTHNMVVLGDELMPKVSWAFNPNLGHDEPVFANGDSEFYDDFNIDDYTFVGYHVPTTHTTNASGNTQRASELKIMSANGFVHSPSLVGDFRANPTSSFRRLLYVMDAELTRNEMGGHEISEQASLLRGHTGVDPYSWLFRPNGLNRPKPVPLFDPKYDRRGYTGRPGDGNLLPEGSGPASARVPRTNVLLGGEYGTATDHQRKTLYVTDGMISSGSAKAGGYISPWYYLTSYRHAEDHPGVIGWIELHQLNDEGKLTKQDADSYHAWQQEHIEGWDPVAAEATGLWANVFPRLKFAPWEPPKELAESEWYRGHVQRDPRVTLKFEQELGHLGGTEAVLETVESVAAVQGGSGLKNYVYHIGNLDSVRWWSGQSNLYEDKLKIEAKVNHAAANMRAMEDPHWSPTDELEGQKVKAAGEFASAAYSGAKMLLDPVLGTGGDFDPETGEMESYSNARRHLVTAYRVADQVSGNTVLHQLSEEELDRKYEGDDWPEWTRLGGYRKELKSAALQVGERVGFAVAEYVPDPASTFHSVMHWASGRSGGWTAPQTLGQAMFGHEQWEGAKEEFETYKRSPDFDRLIPGIIEHDSWELAIPDLLKLTYNSLPPEYQAAFSPPTQSQFVAAVDRNPALLKSDAVIQIAALIQDGTPESSAHATLLIQELPIGLLAYHDENDKLVMTYGEEFFGEDKWDNIKQLAETRKEKLESAYGSAPVAGAFERVIGATMYKRPGDDPGVHTVVESPATQFMRFFGSSAEMFVEGDVNALPFLLPHTKLVGAAGKALGAGKLFQKTHGVINPALTVRGRVAMGATLSRWDPTDEWANSEYTMLRWSNQLMDLRVPTPAGIDYWQQNDGLGARSVRDLLGIDQWKPIRDFNQAGYWARWMGNSAVGGVGIYQSYYDIMYASGLEGEINPTLDNFLELMAIFGDGANFESMVASPFRLGGDLTEAGFVAASPSMKGGRVRAFAAASAPDSYAKAHGLADTDYITSVHHAQHAAIFERLKTGDIDAVMKELESNPTDMAVLNNVARAVGVDDIRQLADIIRTESAKHWGAVADFAKASMLDPDPFLVEVRKSGSYKRNERELQAMVDKGNITPAEKVVALARFEQIAQEGSFRPLGELRIGQRVVKVDPATGDTVSAPYKLVRIEHQIPDDPKASAKKVGIVDDGTGVELAIDAENLSIWNENGVHISPQDYFDRLHLRSSDAPPKKVAAGVHAQGMELPPSERFASTVETALRKGWKQKTVGKGPVERMRSTAVFKMLRRNASMKEIKFMGLDDFLRDREFVSLEEISLKVEEEKLRFDILVRMSEEASDTLVAESLKDNSAKISGISTTVKQFHDAHMDALGPITDKNAPAQVAASMDLDRAGQLQALDLLEDILDQPEWKAIREELIELKNRDGRGGFHREGDGFGSIDESMHEGALRVLDELEQWMANQTELSSDLHAAVEGLRTLYHEVLIQRKEISEASSNIEVERAKAKANEATLDDYMIPGGSNYRQFVFKVPIAWFAGKFQETIHLPDDANVVFFVMVKDRIDANGDTYLSIETLQSDWNQQYDRLKRAGRIDQDPDAIANQMRDTLNELIETEARAEVDPLVTSEGFKEKARKILVEQGADADEFFRLFEIATTKKTRRGDIRILTSGNANWFREIKVNLGKELADLMEAEATRLTEAQVAARTGEAAPPDKPSISPDATPDEVIAVATELLGPESAALVGLNKMHQEHQVVTSGEPPLSSRVWEKAGVFLVAQIAAEGDYAGVSFVPGNLLLPYVKGIQEGGRAQVRRGLMGLYGPELDGNPGRSVSHLRRVVTTAGATIDPDNPPVQLLQFEHRLAADEVNTAPQHVPTAVSAEQMGDFLQLHFKDLIEESGARPWQISQMFEPQIVDGELVMPDTRKAMGRMASRAGRDLIDQELQIIGFVDDQIRRHWKLGQRSRGLYDEVRSELTEYQVKLVADIPGADAHLRAATELLAKIKVQAAKDGIPLHSGLYSKMVGDPLYDPRSGVEGARVQPKPKEERSKAAAALSPLVDHFGGRIGPDVFESVGLRFTPEIKQRLRDRPMPLWMERDGVKRGSFEVKGKDVDVDEASMSVTVTGYRPHFSQLEDMRTEYRNLIDSAKKLEAERGSIDPDVIDLKKQADEVLNDLRQTFEPYLMRALTKDLADPEMVQIRDIRPGFVTAPDGASVPGITLRISGDPNIIQGRLAQFAEAFEQDQIIIHQPVSSIEVDVPLSVLDGTSPLPEGLIFTDQSGAQRAATVVMDLSKSPELVANIDVVLEILGKNNLTGSYNTLNGHLSIPHVGEVSGLDAAAHLDVATDFVRYVHDNYGEAISVDFARENIYVAAPMATRAKKPKKGLPRRKYGYKELVVEGLEAEKDVAAARRSARGEAEGETASPGQLAEGRSGKPVGGLDNRLLALRAAGYEGVGFPGIKPKGKREYTHTEQGKEPSVGERPLGRHEFFREPPSGKVQQRLRDFIIDHYDEPPTPEDLRLLAKDLGLDQAGFNRALGLFVAQQKKKRKKGDRPLPKGLAQRKSFAESKRISMRGLTGPQRRLLGKFIAYESLRVDAHAGVPEPLTINSGRPPEAKDIIIRGTHPGNAKASIAALDAILEDIPDPMKSDELWSEFWYRMTGESRTLVRPSRAAELSNPDEVARYITENITEDQRLAAADGEAATAEFASHYADGTATAEHTVHILLWSMLSRTLSPYPHESGFLDAVIGGVGEHIRKAVAGKFDDTDLGLMDKVGKPRETESIPQWRKRRAEIAADKGTYAEFAQRVLDTVSVYGTPSSQALFNLNAFGKQFLFKMAKPIEDGEFAGQMPLNVIHNALLDQSMSGKEIRRLWLQIAPRGVGIDLKVISFLLIMTGRTDVLVLDRVQMRHMWDNAGNEAVYGNSNIYDGYGRMADPLTKSPNEWSTHSTTYGLGDSINGVRGLGVYEAMEAALKDAAARGYEIAGRPGEGTLSRFHWESWVIESDQEVTHGSISAIISMIEGVDSPAAGHVVRQGKRDTFYYGVEYVVFEGDQRRFLLTNSKGEVYVTDRKGLTGYLKDAKSALPSGYSVTKDPGPWWGNITSDARDKLVADNARPANADELQQIHREADGPRSASSPGEGRTGRALSGEVDAGSGVGLSGVQERVDPISGYRTRYDDLDHAIGSTADIPPEISRGIYNEFGADIRRNTQSAVADTRHKTGSIPYQQITDGKKYQDVIDLIKAESERPGSPMEGWTVNVYGAVTDKAGVQVLDKNGEPVFTEPDFGSKDYSTKDVHVRNPLGEKTEHVNPADMLLDRVTLEIAKALVEPESSKRFGKSGPSGGAMGVKARSPGGRPVKVRSLADSMWQIEWMDSALKKQREILSELGLNMSNEQFAANHFIKMAEEVHKALTGKPADMSRVGVQVTSAVRPDQTLSRARHILARDARLRDMELVVDYKNRRYEGPFYQRKDGKIAGTFQAGRTVDPLTGQASSTSKYIITMFRGGNFDTLMHETGHMLAEMMGERWRDYYINAGWELDVNGKLTKRGHEDAANAFENYVRYGTAPNGKMRAMFSKLHARLRELYVRIRAKLGKEDGFDIPVEMREHWDRILRPDHHMTGAVVSMMDDVAIQRNLPFIVLKEGVVERLTDGKVILLQRKMEGLRVDARAEHVQQALGVRPGDKANPLDLLAGILAYTRTEQMRRTMAVHDLKPLTMRTIVPKERVKAVVARVKKRFSENVIDDSGAEMDPKTFIRKFGDIDAESIAPDAAAQAGLKAWVQEVAAEPMGNIVPERLLDEGADFSKLSFEEYNTVVEAAVDIEAGVAARRDVRAEMVPPSIGYALLSGITKQGPKVLEDTVGMKSVDEYKRGIKQFFSVESKYEKVLDPGVTELVDQLMRELGGVHGWYKQQQALLQPKGMFGTFKKRSFAKTVQALVGQLTPPISPANAGLLFSIRQVWNDSRAAYFMTPDDVSIEGLQLEQLLKREHLETIRGIFVEGGGFFVDPAGGTALERSALAYLENYASRLAQAKELGVDVPSLPKLEVELAALEAQLPPDHLKLREDTADLRREVKLFGIDEELPAAEALMLGQDLVLRGLSPTAKAELLAKREDARTKLAQMEADLAVLEANLPPDHMRLKQEIIGLRAEIVEVTDALGIVKRGIDKRWKQVEARASEVVTSVAGSGDVAILANMLSRPDSLLRSYQAFFEGRWFDMFAEHPGFESGFEVGSRATRNPAAAVMSMIVRMRAQEIVGKFTQDLAKYGLLHTFENMTENVRPTSPQTTKALAGAEAEIGKAYRGTFIDNVVWYIGEEITGKKSIHVLGSGRIADTGIEAPKGEAGLSSPRMMDAAEWSTLESIESGHDMMAYTVAHDILQRYGFTGLKGAYDKFSWPDGSESLLPKVVIEAIQEALERVARLDDASTRAGSAPEYWARNLQLWDVKRRRSSRSAIDPEDLGQMSLHPEQARKMGMSFIDWKELSIPLPRTGGQRIQPRLPERLVEGMPGIAKPFVSESGAVRLPVPGKRVSYPMGAVFDSIVRAGPQLMSALKMGLTVGPIIPNAMYFIGNFLSAFHMVFMKHGLVDSARVLTINPKMTAAVIKRMWGKGRTGGLVNAYHVTKDGRVFSADMLAAEFEKGGLNQSLIKSETVDSLAKETRKMHSGVIKRMMRAPIYWQDFLVEFATASDNAFRIGVAIRELDNGANMAAATKSARDALFDYSKLTDFERTVVKKVILFYSFQRRAADTFMDTLLRNPHRIFGTARITENLHEYYLEGDSQIVLPDYYQFRVPALFREFAMNSKAQGVYTFAPPLPYADVIMLWGDLAGMAQESVLELAAPGHFVPPENDIDKWKTITTKLHPWIQSAFVATTNKDLFYGRDLNGWNEVPPWFIEWDFLISGGFLTDSILNIRPNVVSEEHQIRSVYRRSIEEGSTSFYADDGRAWYVIRNLMHMIPGMGRNMDTITSLDRANVGFVEMTVRLARYRRELQGVPSPVTKGRELVDPDSMPPEVYERYMSGDTMGTRYGLTAWEEIIHAAGLRQYIVPTELEALNRIHRNQERLVKQAQDKLKKYATDEPLEASGQTMRQRAAGGSEALPEIEIPDFLDEDQPLFEYEIETDDDSGDTGY